MQLHALPQPVEEYGRDQRALGGFARFLLHDAGQHQRLLFGEQRRARRTRVPGSVERTVHGEAGAVEQLLAGGATLVVIGVGEDGALLRHGRITGEGIGGVHDTGHLGGGQSLGNGQAVLHRARGAQDGEHLADAGVRRKLQFTGVERSVTEGGDRKGAEHKRAYDDAALREVGGDFLQAAAGDNARGSDREGAGRIVLQKYPARRTTKQENNGQCD